MDYLSYLTIWVFIHYTYMYIYKIHTQIYYNIFIHYRLAIFGILTRAHEIPSIHYRKSIWTLITALMEYPEYLFFNIYPIPRNINIKHPTFEFVVSKVKSSNCFRLHFLWVRNILVTMCIKINRKYFKSYTYAIYRRRSVLCTHASHETCSDLKAVKRRSIIMMDLCKVQTYLNILSNVRRVSLQGLG